MAPNHYYVNYQCYAKVLKSTVSNLLKPNHGAQSLLCKFILNYFLDTQHIIPAVVVTKTLFVQAETDFPIRTELFCIPRVITTLYMENVLCQEAVQVYSSLGGISLWMSQFELQATVSIEREALLLMVQKPDSSASSSQCYMSRSESREVV